jgi:hypothetical protein
MKYLLFIVLLFTCTIQFGCKKKQKTINYFMIEIQPIGISDIPRDTIDISMKDNLTKQLKPTISQQFTLRHIVTDSATLKDIVNFFQNNVPDIQYSQKELADFGSGKILLFNRTKLAKSYSLNPSANKAYLRSLIKLLNENGRDPKVIKVITNEGLSPIEY